MLQNGMYIVHKLFDLKIYIVCASFQAEEAEDDDVGDVSAFVKKQAKQKKADTQSSKSATASKKAKK